MKKPRPPKDLWEQLDQALQEVQAIAPERPPGAFTRSEFEQKYGITIAAARRRLSKLLKAKKITLIRCGLLSYYVMQ